MRRKQQVIELEQRVRQLEEAVALAPAPSLEAENCVLKELLVSVGFNRESLEWYLQGATGVGGLELQNSVDSYSAFDPSAVLSSVTQFVGTESTMAIVRTSNLLLAQKGTDPRNPLQPSDGARQEANQLDPIYASSFTGLDFNHALSAPFSFSRRPDILGSTEMSQTATQNQDVSGPDAVRENLSGILDNLGGGNPIPTGSVNEETTLCSIAFHLVIQCNRTGRDVFELEGKLRYGYRMPASPGEGCRVDNKTLLAVLAELL